MTEKNYLHTNDIRGRVSWIISRMLDNSDEYGIYPTTECFDALEKFINEENKTAREIGYTEANIECAENVAGASL